MQNINSLYVLLFFSMIIFSKFHIHLEFHMICLEFVRALR